MFDLNKHFAAHPYYLLGLKSERERIIALVELAHPKGHNAEPKPLCSTCVLIARITEQS